MSLARKQGHGKRRHGNSEATIDSDLDILLLARTEEKRSLEDAAYSLGEDLRRRFGVRLSPIVFTLREAQSRRKRRDPLMETILKEGLDLGAKSLRQALS
ncbi:MAG: hypothetical protein WCU88_10235 [Elusimicrobiota bacterium]